MPFVEQLTAELQQQYRREQEKIYAKQQAKLKKMEEEKQRKLQEAERQRVLKQDEKLEHLAKCEELDKFSYLPYELALRLDQDECSWWIHILTVPAGVLMLVLACTFNKPSSSPSLPLPANRTHVSNREWDYAYDQFRNSGMSENEAGKAAHAAANSLEKQRLQKEQERNRQR